jgi:hypothetical protein
MEDYCSDQKEAFNVWCGLLESECEILGVTPPDEYDWLNHYRSGLSPEEVAERYGED